MELRVLYTVALLIMILPSKPSGIELSGESFLQAGGLKTHKLISRETHDQVLDIVFPREETVGDPAFVLRFKPSSAVESQIVIKRTINKIELLEYTSLSGNI